MCAIELATGYVSIVPETKGFGKKLEGDLSGPMESAGRSGSSSLGRGLMAGAGLVVGAFTAAVAYGFKEAVSASIEFNSTIETATIGMTTMLGSAGMADAMIRQLTNFAATTPFEIKNLVQSANKMLAFGFAAKDVIPMLTAVGDATSALGLGAEGVDTVIRALGQMKAKAKVSADEMMQLTEAGIPAWDILAQAMGMSTAEVMKLSERGLLPAGKAIDDLVAGMESRFPGMMDKMSKSYSGLMSNLADATNQALGQVLKPAFDWIEKSALPLLINFASDVKNIGLDSAMANIGQKISDMVIANEDSLANAGEWAGRKLGEAIGSTLSVTGAIFEGLLGQESRAKTTGGKIGHSFGQGLMESLNSEVMLFIKEHPALATLLSTAGGATAGFMAGGPWGALIGGGGAAAVVGGTALNPNIDADAYRQQQGMYQGLMAKSAKAASDLAAAHTAVNDALLLYGVNSPQHIAAIAGLTEAEKTAVGVFNDGATVVGVTDAMVAAYGGTAQNQVAPVSNLTGATAGLTAGINEIPKNPFINFSSNVLATQAEVQNFNREMDLLFPGGNKWLNILVNASGTGSFDITKRAAGGWVRNPEVALIGETGDEFVFSPPMLKNLQRGVFPKELGSYLPPQGSVSTNSSVVNIHATVNNPADAILLGRQIAFNGRTRGY